MKAVILLGTLKKEEPSNTEALSDFLVARLEKKGVACVISNFLNAVGVLVPPYATLSVLWDGQKKGGSKPRNELMKKYEEEYASTADKMVEQLLRYAQ